MTAKEANVADVNDTTTRATDEMSLAPPTRHHAVWCLPLNMGSCNGCDQQMLALLAPRYELGRRGISFATSPRHADIVLLTGTLTLRSLEPVRRVLAQVPDPHALIAIGDCALNGGVFAGSPQIVPNAATELGVNIEISGNPPTPTQILLAIEEAARLLDEAEAADEEVEDEAESEDTEEGDEADVDEEEESDTEDGAKPDDVEAEDEA